MESRRPKKLYFCHRCRNEATVSCIGHKQLLELFLNREIEKLPKRQRFRCKQCNRLFHGSTAGKIKCPICNNTDNISLE